MLDRQIIEINTDGKKGNNGTHGVSAGASGLPGQAGASAEDIKITLATDNERIRISYNYAPDIFLPFGYPHTINLKARGGDGGRGGDGAAGYAGRNGRNGEDATEYSAGTSGTDGGDGGPGGDGGRGGNGGAGGHISIHVNESDMDLLALIGDINVNGGTGGAGGRGGSGGPGGQGGRGGSSYSWTVARSHYNSSTNSYETTYINRTSPGGRDGYDGSDGPSGSNGQRGIDGDSGSYKFVVKHSEERYLQYKERYQLQIKGFNLSASEDNIIEPEEKLFVSGLTLRNAGQMPTPKMYSFVFSIAETQWIKFIKESFSLMDQIIPDESFICNEQLNLKIAKPLNTAIDEIFVAHSEVDIHTILPRINKVIATWSVPKPIEIRYPVEMTPIMGKRAILPTEQPPIALQLKNISTKSIGSDSKNKRKIQMSLGSDYEAIKFVDRENQAKFIPLVGGLVQQPTLEEHEGTIYSGTLDFSHLDILTYSIIRFRVTLSLEDLDNPGLLQPIQVRTLNVQFAEEYKFDADTHLTLVVNGNVERDIILKWKDLEKILFTKIAVWHTSLYQGLSYRHVRSDNESFLTQLQGKTVAILNNVFKDSMDNQLRATDYLDSSELFEAARYASISTYVVGNGFEIEKAILPTDHYPIIPRANIKQIVTSKTTDPSCFRQYDSIDVVSKKIFFKKPTEKGFTAVSTSLNKKLQNHFPQQSYFIFQHFQPRITQKGCFTHTWSKGTIEVRQGLDLTYASIIQAKTNDRLQVDNIDIYHIFKLMPFKKKLDRVGLIAENEEIASLLLNAILSDLVDEQIVFRKDAWSGPLPKDKLATKLINLSQLLNYPFNELLHTEKTRLFLEKLLISYSYLVNELPQFKDYLFFARRGRILTAICQTQVYAWLKQHFGFSKEDIQRKLANHKKEINKISPHELLEKYAKPYGIRTEESLIKQDNWVRAEKILAHEILSTVKHRFSTVSEEKSHFSNDHLRLAAIDRIEQHLKPSPNAEEKQVHEIVVRTFSSFFTENKQPCSSAALSTESLSTSQPLKPDENNLREVAMVYRKIDPQTPRNFGN